MAVFGDVVRARLSGARAAAWTFPDAAAIRAEIARAVPLYAGIERLSAKGDQVQWGGRVLFEDGVFATADGRAHFVPVTPCRSRRTAAGSLLTSRRAAASSSTRWSSATSIRSPARRATPC